MSSFLWTATNFYSKHTAHFYTASFTYLSLCILAQHEQKSVVYYAEKWVEPHFWKRSGLILKGASREQWMPYKYSRWRPSRPSQNILYDPNSNPLAPTCNLEACQQVHKKKVTLFYLSRNVNLIHGCKFSHESREQFKKYPTQGKSIARPFTNLHMEESHLVLENFN